MGVDLARLVIIAVVAAALPATLPAPTTSPAAAPLIETAPPEPSPNSAFALGAQAKTAAPHPIDAATAAGPADAAPQSEAVGAWFDDRELKLSAAGGDKTDMLIDPNACVYPDSFLRNLAGGRDDCGFLKTGPDQSEFLTLPFLALSGWVLVICGVAVLYRFRREWRARRWLRRMQARGLAPIGTYPRRSPHRRSRRSSRHRGATSRRYAG